MKIIKYEHACLLTEQNGEYLIIDPGVFLQDLPELKGSLKAIVVTHEHDDHFSLERIINIVKDNPELTLYAPKSVIEKAASIDCKKQTVSHGDVYEEGEFELRFFGQDHAAIYQASPCSNTGVMVNAKLFYPGDSFTVPPVKSAVLALPAAAPWLKVAESIDYMKAMRSETVFPTHDVMLSSTGKEFTFNWLSRGAEMAGSKWVILDVGSSTSI